MKRIAAAVAVGAALVVGVLAAAAGSGGPAVTAASTTTVPGAPAPAPTTTTTTVDPLDELTSQIAADAAENAPHTPIGNALRACAASPGTEDIGAQVVIDDDGHAIQVDGQDFTIGVACMLEELGLPEWLRSSFPGWVVIDGYTLAWTSDVLGGNNLLIIDSEVAPDVVG
jgi:hypothetical protein